MIWDTIEPEIREAAQATCTPDEIDCLRLYAVGYGYRAIARTLGIDRDTARNRINRANLKIRRHLGKPPLGTTPT